jgi:hypothetical protein
VERNGISILLLPSPGIGEEQVQVVESHGKHIQNVIAENFPKLSEKRHSSCYRRLLRLQTDKTKIETLHVILQLKH